jgi:methylmalonyl-CoA/ethylmalonyl-CoA epimerase
MASGQVTISLAAAALPRVDQVCMLVDDIDEGIARYSAVFPATRWRIYRYGPDSVQGLTFRGQPSDLCFWVALSDCDPQIELIQSLHGPSIYSEWLDQHGTGFHHLGVFTKNLAADTANLEALGLVVSQAGYGYGLDGDGGFAYFDSVATFGVILELIEVPARRRQPDRECVINRRDA